MLQVHLKRNCIFYFGTCPGVCIPSHGFTCHMLTDALTLRDVAPALTPSPNSSSSSYISLRDLINISHIKCPRWNVLFPTLDLPQKVNISSLHGGVQVKKLELSLNSFFLFYSHIRSIAKFCLFYLWSTHTHTHTFTQIYIYTHTRLLSPLLHCSKQLSSLHLTVARALDWPACFLSGIISAAWLMFYIHIIL